MMSEDKRLGKASQSRGLLSLIQEDGHKLAGGRVQ